MNRSLLAAALLAALCAPAWAINKCTAPDGKVSFQDEPCAGRGEPIKVWANPGISLPKPASAKLPVASEVAAPAPSAASAPAQPPVKSPIEQEADICLSWYKPLLRDPAGAYYSQPSKQSRVLSMTLHATNGYGGYTTKGADCEIHNGRLNDSWTKTHAKRLGWSVE